jgi:hypothetical protein
MKYQIVGFTKTPEFDRCIQILRARGLPSNPTVGPIARFDTRDEAELVLAEFRAVVPTEAALSIVEIPETNDESNVA